MNRATSIGRSAALAAAAVLLITACGSTASSAPAASQPATSSGGAPASQATTDQPAEIVWSTWGNPDELGRFDEFNKAFMERHPNIKVTLQPVADYGDYHSKLLAQLTSGTAPDVFYLGDDNVGKFVAAGTVLQPLDDRMNAPGSLAPASDFFDGLFGAARKDGVTYGVPTDDNPDMFWYNKKALAAAGITEDPATLAKEGKWTTEAFLGMVDKLKAAGLTSAMFWNYWATHYSWIEANGGKAWDASGNFILPDDPKAVAALTTLAQRFQDGSFAAADTLPDPGADTLFVTDKAGFFSQGRYTIGTIKAAANPDDFDVVRWPTEDGTPKPTGVAAAYLAINKATESPDAAWTFFQEFVSADGQNFRLQGGGNAVPSVKGADEVVLDGYPPNAQAILDARDIGFAAIPAEQVHPGLSTDISDAMLKLYEGKASVQDTLTTIKDLVANAQ